MIDASHQGNIHVITLNAGQNQIHPDWLARMHEVLDDVESNCAGDGAVVVTGEGKFFSNGLDVARIMRLPPAQTARFAPDIARMFRRLLGLAVPTVAAINGHAFAAGAFLALACDYRIMREDKGWLCISEVDAGVPISSALMALLRAKLKPDIARDAVLSGRRYTAGEALAAGMVDRSSTQAALLPSAIELVTPLSVKKRGIFKTLKHELYADVLAALDAA